MHLGEIEESMKKLIVLMIVLFPVTAWAGGHHVPRKDICSRINSEAGELLTYMNDNFIKQHSASMCKSGRVPERGYKATDQCRRDLEDATRQIESDLKILAEWGSVYNAFCK